MIGSLLQRNLEPAASRIQETFYPLGFPLVVSSNSEAVLKAAHIEWDAWAIRSPKFDEPPIVLTFHVSEETPELPDTSEFHAHLHQFTFVADLRNHAVCDTRTHTGVAWITASAAGDPAWLRYHFLEAMALEMIVSLHMTPFHAACVANKNGSGVLLCGDSGAGKSSLSYACARRGWAYLSDDATYLIRDRASERIVLGHPHRIRLRPDAPHLFGELWDYQPTRRGNGKMSLEISLAGLNIWSARQTRIDRIILLKRAAHNRLTQANESAARSLCEPIFYWWDPKISAAQQRAFDTLLAAVTVHSLEYSNLDAAIDLLER
ncbi:MAG TPA: hypothetical protein VKR43_09755 [Bryobacteraceae bacterium]|nr:hypothetical protein [Bryobacteraceae bacterium]